MMRPVNQLTLVAKPQVEAAPHMFTQCPACGAPLLGHTSVTPEDYEAWDFECGAQVYRTESRTYAEGDPCPRALRVAVRRINQETPHV